MRIIYKRFLVFFLSFLIAFNIISSDYQCSKIEASAATISLLDVLYATAATVGIPLAFGVGGAVIAKNVEDAFISYITGTDSKDIDTWTRVSNGTAFGISVTSNMVNDVKGWLETLGIETKSGSVVEKTVSISSGALTWFNTDIFSLSYPWINSSGTTCYLNSVVFTDIQPNRYAIAITNSPGNTYKIFFISDTMFQNAYRGSGQRSISGYSFNDAKKYFYDKYVVTGDGWTSSMTKIKADFTVGDYYVYWTWGDDVFVNKENCLCNVDIDKFLYVESTDELKQILGGEKSAVDVTIPSIGTYDDTNISNLTDGRTLSAADLQAIADAINNPYADYKNSDGAITQEDLQAAVTAAIAAALAAAGEKEEPDNPTDDPVITAGFQGVFDWFQKVFDLLKTFFATATTFVTTFPLKLWKDALETFPATLANIQDAVGDVFKVGEQISEALITFPTAESLKDLITGVPSDLADLKDAVTIFPKAFQDAMTGVITDVFPAALIGALEDALPSYIAAGVTALPLQLVDILIPQLDLSIPKALEGSLPKILTDALSGSITIPDIKVNFPTLEIPNYMDILGQILAAILAIPALLTLDVPAIKTAAQAATKDVALETGIEPIITLFDGMRFGDEIIYPVIAVDTPDILKTYYQEPQIILLDFEDYAQYCQWARNIFRVTLWLAFLYWAAKQLQVHYHIA